MASPMKRVDAPGCRASSWSTSTAQLVVTCFCVTVCCFWLSTFHHRCFCFKIQMQCSLTMWYWTIPKRSYVCAPTSTAGVSIPSPGCLIDTINTVALLACWCCRYTCPWQVHCAMGCYEKWWVSALVIAIWEYDVLLNANHVITNLLGWNGEF